eukprot:4050480-Amphidinium_carterae.1
MLEAGGIARQVKSEWDDLAKQRETILWILKHRDEFFRSGAAGFVGPDGEGPVVLWASPPPAPTNDINCEQLIVSTSSALKQPRLPSDATKSMVWCGGIRNPEGWYPFLGLVADPATGNSFDPPMTPYRNLQQHDWGGVKGNYTSPYILA